MRCTVYWRETRSCEETLERIIQDDDRELREYLLTVGHRPGCPPGWCSREEPQPRPLAGRYLVMSDPATGVHIYSLGGLPEPADDDHPYPSNLVEVYRTEVADGWWASEEPYLVAPTPVSGHQWVPVAQVPVTAAPRVRDSSEESTSEDELEIHGSSSDDASLEEARRRLAADDEIHGSSSDDGSLREMSYDTSSDGSESCLETCAKKIADWDSTTYVDSSTVSARGHEWRLLTGRRVEYEEAEQLWMALLLDELYLRGHGGREIFCTLQDLLDLSAYRGSYPCRKWTSLRLVRDLTGWRTRLYDYVGCDLSGMDWTDLAATGSAVIYCTLQQARPEHYLDSDLDLICHSADYPAYLRRVVQTYQWYREQEGCQGATLQCLLRVYSDDGREYPEAAGQLLAETRTQVPGDWETSIDYRQGWCHPTPGWGEDAPVRASLLWRIQGPGHPLEIHHSLSPPESAVPFYHVPPVRAYYDGHEVYYTYSATLAYRTGQMVDLRVCRELENRKGVVEKSMNRGFDQIQWPEDESRIPYRTMVVSRVPCESATSPDTWEVLRDTERHILAVPYWRHAIIERDPTIMEWLIQSSEAPGFWQAVLGLTDDYGRPLERYLPELISSLPLSWVCRYRREIRAVLSGDYEALAASRDPTIRYLVRDVGRHVDYPSWPLHHTLWYPDGSLLDHIDYGSREYLLKIMASSPRLIRGELEHGTDIYLHDTLTVIYRSIESLDSESWGYLEERTAGRESRITQKMLVLPARLISRSGLDLKIVNRLPPMEVEGAFSDDSESSGEDYQGWMGIHLEQVGTYQADQLYIIWCRSDCQRFVPPMASLWRRHKGAC